MDKTTVQGSEEWLAARKRTANASETPCLFGENPWFPKTPRQLWDLKHDLVDVHNNKAMQRGTDYEDEARSKAEQELEVMLSPMVFRDTIEGVPFSASLDGVDLNGTVNVEIKVPYSGKDSPTWKKAESGSLGHYRWQVQTQMLVSGLERTLFFVYDPDTQESVSCEVKADPDMQQQIVEAWSLFWQYMDEGKEPPLIDRDYVERDDQPYRDAVENFIEAQEEYVTASQKIKNAKKILENLSGETNSRGFGITVTKVNRKGSIDYANIPALERVDLEQYRKTGSSYWKVTVNI